MITDTTRDAALLHPDGWYSSLEIARALKCGLSAVQRAIKKGDLKASCINGRGDRRSAGRWVFEWLELRAREMDDEALRRREALRRARGASQPAQEHA